MSFEDIRQAVRTATSIEAFAPDRPRGGLRTTHWRVRGVDLDGEPLGIGLDLTADQLGDHALVVTVF